MASKPLSAQGQAEVWRLMFAFSESMALKCAVELGIADIIQSHGCPITLSQIASGIKAPNLQTNDLARMMKFLARKKIFTSQKSSDGETLYGLNEKSKWIIRDQELSLAPMILMENSWWQLKPWLYMSQCIKEEGMPFEVCHGCNVWGLVSKSPEDNILLNNAMACVSRIVVKAFISEYKDGFKGISSWVDVGGGIGQCVSEIVKANPHIRGINLDLPHVVATAPSHEGVTHVAGSMFEAVPSADVVWMKWVLHDWADEYCIKILKNCRKAIPEKTGRLILAEIILKEEDDEDLFGETGLVFDILMYAHCIRGKERTEAEWKKLLEQGGFPRYRIIKIPSLLSIIEAYPN